MTTSGAEMYSVSLEVGQAPPCGGGVETLVDATAIVVSDVLEFDLVVTSCADGSIADGTVFAITPSPSARGWLPTRASGRFGQPEVAAK